MPRIAHFTAGTIGVGHFVHAYAIHRALGRAGFDGEFRLFGPKWPYACTALPWYRPTAIDGPALLDPRRAAHTDLARALLAYRPDLLLIDMFWAPIHHLRRLLDCEVWLLLRKFVDPFLVGIGETFYDPARWDRIIAIEPIDHPSLTHRVEPIVCANPDECRPPEALRERLNVPPEKTLAVVAHTGSREEQQVLAAVGDEDVQVVHFDLTDAASPFPLAEWLGGADVIMTGAGYNTFWESRWLGFHDRCFFTAFPRPIDDQAWRARQCADHTPTANGADTIAGWIVE
jgi:hypothetical protein